MARIATIAKKEDLAPEHQKVYDAIAQSRGVVGGPWLALLHSPEMAARTAASGQLRPLRIDFRSQSRRVYRAGVGAGARLQA